MGQNHNGSGVTGPGTGPNDEHHGRGDALGQGQSGAGAGRPEGDRFERWDGPEAGVHSDERFSRERDREPYWLDRTDRPNRPWAAIREAVCEALTAREDIDASNIDVTVTGGEVTLSGTVEDERTKRIAEAAATQCSGVTDVSNQLTIERTPRA